MDLWQQIPDSVLDIEKRTQQADDWQKQQRQKLADQWLNMQQNVLKTVQNAWQSDVSGITAPLGPSQGSQPVRTTPIPEYQTPEFIQQAEQGGGALGTAAQGADTALKGLDWIQNNVANPFLGAGYGTIDTARGALTGQQTPFTQNLPQDTLQDPFAQWRELGARWRTRQDVTNDNIPPEQQTSAQIMHTAADVFNPVYWAMGGPFAKSAEGGVEALPTAANFTMAAGQAASETPQLPGESQSFYNTRTQVGDVAQLAGMGAQGAEGLYKAGRALAPIAKGVAGVAGQGLEALGRVGTEAGLVPGLTVRPPGLVGDQGPFYSMLEKLIDEKVGGKATGDQIRKTLFSGGVTKGEMEHTGLSDFLEQNKNRVITKNELRDFVNQNAIQVQEVVRGAPAFGADKRSQIIDRLHANTQQQDEILNRLIAKYGMDFESKASPQELAPYRKLTEEEDSLRNSIDLNEHPLDAKYESYTTPGGQNYRELLLTMPQSGGLTPSEEQRFQQLRNLSDNVRALNSDELKEYDRLYQQRVQADTAAYNGPHWNEPNVLAHVRFDDRVSPDGKKTLFIQEVQSDWAQQGRKRGFSNVTQLPEEYKVQEANSPEGPLYRVVGPDYRYLGGGWSRDRGDAIRSAMMDLNKGKIPPTPFAKTEDWTKLALKRIIAWASEHGYDRVAWTTGQMQADRYNLAQHVDAIHYDPSTNTVWGSKGAQTVFTHTATPKELPEVIGQEATKAILAAPADSQGKHTIRGNDLQVGGEGMKAYYDKIMPNVASDLIKKHGGKVGSSEISQVASNIDPSSISPSQLRKLGDEASASSNLTFSQSKKIKLQAYTTASDIENGLSFEEAIANNGNPRNLLLEYLKGNVAKPITVHSFDLTPSLKTQAARGQALFSAVPLAGALTPQLPGESDEDYQKRRIASAAAAAGILGGRRVLQDASLVGEGKPFYSLLEHLIDTKVGSKATGQQVLKMLESNGAKEAELSWTGLKQFLQDHSGEAISKSALKDFVTKNGIGIQEQIKNIPDEPDDELIAQYNELGNVYAREFDALRNRIAKVLGNRRTDEFLMNMSETEGPFDLQQAVSGFRQSTQSLLLKPDIRAAVEHVDGLWKRLTEMETAINTPHPNMVGYTRWSLPGGTDYHEVLLKLPISSANPTMGKKFIGSHWKEPNVLVHLRFDTRTGPNGEKILFVQEIQSDWAQQGRRGGFLTPEVTQKADALDAQIKALNDQRRAIEEEYTSKYNPGSSSNYVDAWMKAQAAAQDDPRMAPLDAQIRELTNQRIDLAPNSKYPPTPFAKTEDFTKLALKRIINWASERGYDKIAWTPGEMQDARYAGAETSLKPYYDKIIPSVAKDLVKKYGANVTNDVKFNVPSDSYYIDEWGPEGGEPGYYIRDQNPDNLDSTEDRIVGGPHTTIEDAEAALADIQGKPNFQSFPGFDVTPALRATALKGQSLFAVAPAALAVAPQMPGESDEEYQRRRQIGLYGTGAALLAGHIRNPNPILAGLDDMLAEEAPRSKYLQSMPTIERWITDFQRAWTDNGIDLRKLQEQAAKAVGRGLHPEEMLAELRLLSPNPAAEVKIRSKLAPAIQSVGEDLPALSKYLILRHNVEVADQAGEYARRDVMNQPLRGIPAQNQLRRLNQRLTMFNRFLAQAHANNDMTAVQHYTRRINRVNQDITRATARLNQQTNVAQVRQFRQANIAAQTARQDRVFSTGIDVDESLQGLQALEQQLGPQRWQQVEQAAQQITQFGRDLLQSKVDAGIIEQRFANHLMAMYPEYVPVKIMDFLGEAPKPAVGQSKTLSMRDVNIKRLTREGSAAAQEDPLSAMIRLAYQTESANFRNRTFNAVVNIRNLDPALQYVFKEVDNSYTPKAATEGVIQGFVNGERKTYVMPKDLADTIQSAPASSIPGLSKAMSILRGLLASNNPLFVPTHAMITIIPYLVRTTTREGGPQALPRVVASLASAYIDAFKGIETGNFGAHTEAYIKAGGGMFGKPFESSPTGTKLALEDLTRNNTLSRGINTVGDSYGIKVTNAARLKRITTDVLTGKPVAEIINRVDLAPRVAAFNLARARGLSDTQAATMGRTATIDFAMGGNWARVINSFVPFFNVGLQGAAAPYRAFKDNPAAFVASAATLIALPTVIAEAWNRSDPQRNQDYNDVPEYYKNSGIVVMLPGPAPVDGQGNRKPQFIYVPTREYSPFVALSRYAAGKALNPATGGQIATAEDTQSWGDLLVGAVDDLSPISVSDYGAGIGRVVPGGPFVGTPVQLLTNTNLGTGASIASKAADQRAGLLARAGASGLNTLGNAAAQFMGNQPDIAVRPSQVQFAMQELGGGPGELAASVGQEDQNAGNVPQYQPVTGPAISRFVRGSTGQQLANAREVSMPPNLRRLLAEGGINSVAPASQEIRNMPLTQREETELQTRMNKALDEWAVQLDNYPGFQKLSPAEKQMVIKRTMSAMRQQVARSYLGDLIQRYGEDKIRQRIEQAKQQTDQQVAASASP